ncbi:MAG: methyltransferase [Acidimicrobiia bacterium]
MNKPARASAREAVGMPLPPASVVELANRFRNLIGRSHSKMQPPFALILERLFGLIDNKMLGLLVELEIPDLLHGAPKSAEELARDTGADVDALDRVLRFLVSRDLLGITSDGRYENNKTSELLRDEHPYSWKGWVEFFASDWNWDIWGDAMHSVMKGGGAAEAALGLPFFDYLNSNAEAGSAFNAAMQSGSTMQGLLVQEKYDFSRSRHVCDVGGGTGAVLGNLLTVNPQMRGTLFELPVVAEQARAHLDSLSLLDRCEVVSGDFFDPMPVEADIYTLFAVVHDWGDEEAGQILENIRRAMPADGRVLVIEGVIPDHSHYNFSKVSDLLMLVYSDSGRERTKEEFDNLFARAGFRVKRVLKLPSLFRIFELEAAGG